MSIHLKIFTIVRFILASWLIRLVVWDHRFATVVQLLGVNRFELYPYANLLERDFKVKHVVLLKAIFK